MEILRLENVTFRYPKAAASAVENINLVVESGEFVVICGESGCGKTTLLRLLKRELAPAGEKTGTVFYRGTPLEALDERTNAAQIGYVLQNPDNQIVTDKVWHELAFGLENLGVPTALIRRRVGEMASYFGIQNWFRKDTDQLSGGEKQLLNLASVMVMGPKVLILDEPTSQLDPIAASEFIATLHKLNRELGLTILLVEHRLEDVFPMADKVLVMEQGRALLYDTPGQVGRRLGELQKDHPMLLGLPSAVRLYNALASGGRHPRALSDPCPLTVKEGRDFLEKHFGGRVQESGEGLPGRMNSAASHEEAVIELDKVWFRYEKDLPDILRGLSLKVYRGETYCILGGNGTGKTTALNVISGLNKAYRGKVRIAGKLIKAYRGQSLYRENLAFLPQNPQTVFIRDKVRDDYREILDVWQVPKGQQGELVERMAEKIGVTHLLDKHPFDLSGGEQQKCALGKVLMSKPKILLLDEPTKGLDACSKHALGGLLGELKEEGMTILMVTHDVEFAAENADRCALFFDGEILSADVPELFFAENNFYTTAANRMARELWPYAVTCDQVARRCMELPEEEGL